ncbi:MAG: hypothetical protein N3A38_13125, partial [Planctomycetota bacterium]|nr:hypothetical protein [Planctomycetota bacterium]
CIYDSANGGGGQAGRGDPVPVLIRGRHEAVRDRREAVRRRGADIRGRIRMDHIRIFPGTRGEGAAGPAALAAAACCLLLAAARAGVSAGEPVADGRQEKACRFATPVWHPDARWEKSKERFAGLDVGGTYSMGELDGPRREIINRTIGRPLLHSGLSSSGRYVYMSYDAKTERYHGVTAGAAGYLDGPFSRARFFGDDYLPRQAFRETSSPDGRYAYLISDKWGDARLRCLDFAEQKVSTLATGSATPLNVAVGESGKLYVVNYSHELVVLDPKDGWKAVHTVKLDTAEQLNALSNSLAADEVHGRIYASSYRPKSWYVWYWDIRDGSLRGVLPMPGMDGPAREGGMGGAAPGPFKGTRMYGECTVGFGPDDPGKRFLYVGSIDDPSFYRLDLEKQWFYKFDSTKGVFIGEGGRRHPEVTYAVLPTWFEDGSFMGTYQFLWRRVQ